MNPALTPVRPSSPKSPRRGTDRTRTNACSPHGRGRGWVGLTGRLVRHLAGSGPVKWQGTVEHRPWSLDIFRWTRCGKFSIMASDGNDPPARANAFGG